MLNSISVSNRTTITCKIVEVKVVASKSRVSTILKNPGDAQNEYNSYNGTLIILNKMEISGVVLEFLIDKTILSRQQHDRGCLNAEIYLEIIKINHDNLSTF